MLNTSSSDYRISTPKHILLLLSPFFEAIFQETKRLQGKKKPKPPNSSGDSGSVPRAGIGILKRGKPKSIKLSYKSIVYKYIN